MKKFFRISYLSLIFAFFYIPIAIVVWLSFNASQYSLLWHGFSWHWYQQLFIDDDMQLVAIHSLLIGILASTTATILGFVAAISLYRYRFFANKSIKNILFIFIIIPDLVIAIAMLLAFNYLHIQLGFFTVLLAHITMCLPFAWIMISSQLFHFNREWVFAARDLGASDWRIVTKIFFPILSPAIFAAWLLSFTLSFDDVVISYFVTGPNFSVLPLKIFSMVRGGVSPEVNALCTILLVLTIIIVLCSQWLLNKKVA